MTSFSSLRVRLVGTVFLAIAPAWLVMNRYNLPWTGFVVGLLALAAAWYGGERFILRQVRMLVRAAKRLREGDLSARTGLSRERGELGDLARTFDSIAGSLQERATDREETEKTLINRSFQQTVVGAMGQFALVSSDFTALRNQAVMLASQTLEVEYCGIFELVPDGRKMVLRSGVGWKPGSLDTATVTTDSGTQCGFTLSAGEPVVVEAFSQETRFRASPFLAEHGVVSSVTVAVSGQGHSFGILGAYTARPRKFTEDEVHFLLAIATLLAMAAARKKAEAEILKLAAFAQLNPNPAMELTADGTITYCNDAAYKLTRAVGRGDPQAILPSNIDHVLKTCLETGQRVLRLEIQIEGRTLSWSFYPVTESRIVHGYVDDVTEHINLEAQLRQAQKMESVGQLAAGVAHDFNNMLTVIQGHAGMLTARPNLAPDLAEAVQAIFFASERAASLTRQLLMFSRKNVMQPKLLDLREVVSNLKKMLERVLGETISLEFQPPHELPLVHGDAGMLEQVLMNLAVNARDAMPRGGTLSISTTDVQIDQAYVRTRPEAKEGQFVCLQVTDTGSGMDAATMRRIFEPFFTTKEVGKGTGLGLATVYGIVKQHGGWIEVASQVGTGTTFSVFFPAGSEPVAAKTTAPAPVAVVPGGKETILVVEDEPVLRDLAHTILEDCGYRILEASSGREALDVWNTSAGAIDLVLTDMIMPEGVSGMDLAETLLASKPRLKIIFASGYSMDELDTDFIRQGRATFLQKPYTHVSLAKAVRECLDR
jgi:signal transduction histidine kinase